MNEEIKQFLAENRVGFVGVSRDKTKFGNKVYEKLRECNYQVYPVHPEMESVGEDTCFKAVTELPDDVRALMLVASPGVCTQVLEQLTETGIECVWIFIGPGKQPELQTNVQRLANAGISTVFNCCPFMFLEPVDSIHSLHRFVARLLGKYPK